MPRSVVSSLIAAVAFACASATASAGEYWGAVSIAPDGVFGAATEHYSASHAEGVVMESCRTQSSRPDECVVRSVEGRRSLLAWHCVAEGQTDGIGIITMVWSYDIDEHIAEMTSGVRGGGYKPEQCKPVVYVTGRWGKTISDGKEF
jgi:hypothetical protein